MSQPTITYLQFLVLCELASGTITGHELRRRLDAEGVSKSGPAFYQLMSRLEDAKLVEGRYRNTTIERQVVRERLYEISGAGVTIAQQYADSVRRASAKAQWVWEV
jgi:DNA-binding PadR family transcriptional regulator